MTNAYKKKIVCAMLPTRSTLRTNHRVKYPMRV